MSFLLIDHHDSYTFNIAQLLGTLTGVEPAVLSHDDPRLNDIDLTQSQGVILSPGPGRPQRGHDLGWTGDFLRGNVDVPVLGVCLGHQAIAHVSGARVVPGQARHGFVDRIHHDGSDLFNGVPQGFPATRYHSLQVVGLPSLLQATAWSVDGTVMALRHLTRPRWGVQFHPESICTEHGDLILANFVELASHWSRRHASRDPGHGPWVGWTAPAATPLEPVDSEAGREPDEPVPLELLVERVGFEADAESLFATAFGGARHAFWLDSSLVEPGRSRFSFLGDDSGPLSETLSYRAGSGGVDVRRGRRRTRESGTIFAVLDRRLRQRRLPPSDLPFRFDGGYVGYFGYELHHEAIGGPLRHGTAPDSLWTFADRLVAIDHEQRVTYLVTVCGPGAAAREEAHAWMAGIRVQLRPGSLDPRPVLPPPVGPDLVPVEDLRRTRDQYLADVETCLEELRRGESYEICLTNQFASPRVVRPLAFYCALRRVSPARYSAFLRFDRLHVMSSSPERFLTIEPDGRVVSEPIKGTVRRSGDADEDAALLGSLTSSEKTAAEMLMIVDLIRSDLGRVCETGSVSVDSLMYAETCATVHQLVSRIRGRLRPSVTAVDAVRACFPGGSMTGAPKLRTVEILDRLEQRPRGIYSGALGFLGCGGGADLSIVIRTAVDDGIDFTVGVGGAVVLASEPAEEFEETLLKARAIYLARAAALSAGRAGRKTD